MIQHKKVILGSASPRRKELLTKLGVKFDQQVFEIDETYPLDLSPYDVPEYLAKLKSHSFSNLIDENAVVITSDTVVVDSNKILGKPTDESDALQMILKLSNKVHHVVTGVCLLFHNKRISFSNTSKVYFEPISEQEAKFYIDTFSPLDKAGAYGIQEWIGQSRIRKIDGCYYNIMGLPLNALYNQFIKEKIISF